MSNLFERSIEIILENQAQNGAFVASPSFWNYQYCWFRDGSYVAYAMDLAGEHESSHRFHEWAAQRVNDRRETVLSGLSKAAAGQQLADEDILHTRYRIDGQEAEPSGRGNFQLDGLGTWLWALNEHFRQIPGMEPWSSVLDAAEVVADYLSGLWALPCYDCWEEYPEHLHPYTLAAIYGGLRAHTELTSIDHQDVVDSIRSHLLDGAREFGHFAKFPGSPVVDASLLGLAVPYHVVAPDDPLMLKTIERIETTLLRKGGLHRYAADSYYGGGAWILLSAWLGWYCVELARTRPDLSASLRLKIGMLSAWIEAQAGSGLELSEQVPQDLNDASFYPAWIERWGPIASPLLWSHAQYIILATYGQK